MKKRILSGIMAAAVCCGLFTGCKTDTALEKDVTLTVKVPSIMLTPAFDSDISTSYDFLIKAADAFEEENKDANLTINVIEFEPTEQTAEIDDCFDTDNAADIFYADFFNSEAYVHSGRVVPLDDIITDDIKKDIDETFWDMCTQNGKIYMMPFLYRQNILSYNKDMFKSCGLEKYCSDKGEVQTWTMQEWDEILAALKAGLGDNKYPLMMYAANNQGDTHVMTYIRSQGSKFFDDDGNFNLNTPEGIAGLQWIKSLQEKGYFPANADELEILDNSDMFTNQQLAIHLVNDATEPLYDFNIGFVNFPSINGGISTNFNTGFEVFDNGDEAKLSAAKAFVKYIYESDWLDYSAGSIPCSKRVAEKYADDLSSAQKYLDNASTGVRFTGGDPNWVGVRKVFYPNIQKLLTGEYTAEKAAEMLDKECNEAIEKGRSESKLHE